MYYLHIRLTEGWQVPVSGECSIEPQKEVWNRRNQLRDWFSFYEV